MLGLVACATPPGGQTALNSESTSSLHTLRNAYLSQTQSDPLGAYLSHDDDIAIDYPSSTTARTSNSPSTSTPSKTIAGTALKFLGVKYRYGGGSPSTGFDCSGLVVYAAEKSLGLQLPRRSRDIASEGRSIKSNELRKGDLVFFNTLGHRFSHVGIYLGNRQFVHAPRSGAKVRVENMDIAYWSKRYNGARRLQADASIPRTASRN
ncbi:C40 family peptidase [Alcaligenaceae bacterium CGII-47]|nr:C40 family peptidase [Alcaligenaceae bacterium CGII-47]